MKPCWAARDLGQLYRQPYGKTLATLGRPLGRLRFTDETKDMISTHQCLDVWTTKPGSTADGRRTGSQAHYLASNPNATRLDEWPVARELLLRSTVGQAVIT